MLHQCVNLFWDKADEAVAEKWQISRRKWQKVEESGNLLKCPKPLPIEHYSQIAIKKLPKKIKTATF